MVKISGYQITEQIYARAKTLVYRGIRESDQMPVVIKVMGREYPSFNEVVQFRNQYIITQNLDIPGIIKPLSLEVYGQGYALVMEDFGGISLHEWGVNNGEWGVGNFLIVAVQIAIVLDQLHRNRIIHKDIKPGNILINPNTKQIKIIDFSIASLLPQEKQQIENPNVLEGTLAYISPEQTGRMNRGIDYRTDFYSLGVTFYQMLTGKLPFTYDEPLELVYCHITKQPVAVNTINPNIPKILSDIVAKLMAKNPEERYQSALGLKYDLETCLHLYKDNKETAKIPSFTLGSKDIFDRFLIPEKLYGRKAEVDILLEAFQRVSLGSTEMLLVGGFSGIGKTSLVNEVHKPIVAQRGYFIKGKYDQFQRNIPFSAFVQAFLDLIEQLLTESDAQLQLWKARILDAVGESGQVIIDVIPKVELLIGKQPPVAKLDSALAQNRFNLVFQKFIKVFASVEYPLIIFLDDLQWADSASLKLIYLLMVEAKVEYLLLIVAYRDNEVSPAHPFLLTTGDIQKAGAKVERITLDALDFHSLNQLVADTLNRNSSQTHTLTEYIYNKSKGNPFFSRQLLNTLYQEKVITFNYEQGMWCWQLNTIRDLSLSEDVVEFMAQRLQILPSVTQDVLKLAACIGNQFDLNILAKVSELGTEKTAKALWSAIQEGLILPLGKGYKLFQGTRFVELKEPVPLNKAITYRFLHDRVQQSAYSLIANDKKEYTHLKIGRLLLNDVQNNLLTELPGERIFEITNQLNIAITLITNEEEKEKLTQLNLLAGRKAKSSTAYSVALDYFQKGIDLLAVDSWSKKYEITRELYVELIEVQYLLGLFDKSEKLIIYAINKVKSNLEKAEIYNLLILLETLRANYQKAIDAGRKALEMLDVYLPESNLNTALEKEFSEIERQLGSCKVDSLLKKAEMDEQKQQIALKILKNIDPPAYFVDQQLYCIIVTKSVNLSLEYGNSPDSPKGFSTYGLILGSMQGNYRRGYEFGELALAVSEKFNNKSQKCQVCVIIAGYLNHWVKHVKEANYLLDEGYKVGLESGDLQFAGYTLIFRALNEFHQGINLEIFLEKISQYLEFCQKTKNQWAIDAMIGCKIIALNLCEKSHHELNLQDKDIDEKSFLENCHSHGSFSWICTYQIFKSKILYLFENYEDALKFAEGTEKYLTYILGHFSTFKQKFYLSLSITALYHKFSFSKQQQYQKILTANQEKMRIWAENCPDNFLHKYYLVEAEQHRVFKEYIEAMELYDRAISLACQNEYVNDEALAYELAAKFYLEWDKKLIAQTYMLKAYEAYQRWGATAKLEHLKQNYPQLLNSIISTSSLIQSNSLLDKSINDSYHSTTPSESLDFKAILKASQSLSSEIKLEQLLTNLMQVVLENAGADKGALLLLNNDIMEMSIQAIDGEVCSVEVNKLEKSDDLPYSLINYVRRALKTVIINDASTNISFSKDLYLQKQQPQSLLCLPIINKNQLIGILYLENNLLTNAFTKSRVEVLSLLCSQAAISLENAKLYQTSHSYAQKLEQTLQELTSAQTQLVQSEKMSALGNLVSGVAHEINNPVGFIAGNIQPALDFIKDLFGLLDLYQQEYPNPSLLIQDEIETIDLHYIRSDLPKLLNSMKEGVQRIKNISTSLRTFSRADTENKTAFNIHDGIDSTIMILKHRLKADENRPEIQVIKNYGELPQVQCFAGQLNQVFMNLLANAIDALEESNYERSYKDIEELPNCIIITTSLDTDNKQIIVSIKDNGKGMSEEVKQRIFDHLFTTKSVGNGTGLGLAIARQIITEKHGGSINVNSTLGEGAEFVITIPLG